MISVPIGRKGKYGIIEVDRDALPEHVSEHVWVYGIRQILNDAVSDKEGMSDGDVFAKAQAKLDQLMAGELRKRGDSAEPLDPVEAEAYRMAKATIEKALRKGGYWPKNGQDKFQKAVDARRLHMRQEPMDEADFIAQWLERNPGVMKEAERRVKMFNQLDLGDAGL